MSEVPLTWLPFGERLLWFWYPPEWQKTPPMTQGAQVALLSSDGTLLMELFAAKAKDSLKTWSDIQQDSVRSDHPDATVLSQGPFAFTGSDDTAAYERVTRHGFSGAPQSSLGLPSESRRLIMEYADRTIHGTREKFTLDCFFLLRQGLVVMPFFKTLSSRYGARTASIEGVVCSMKLGGL